MNGYYGIQYIPDSYNALGQDGLRFNQNINNPTNTVVPPDIADALYNNSDHLPIYMKVFIRHDQSGLSSENKLNNIKVVSPAQGKIDVNLLLDKPNYYTFKLINLLGELIFSKQFYFTVGNIPWKIFRVNAIYFAAFGRAGQPLPTAQLAGLAAELDHNK